MKQFRYLFLFVFSLLHVAARADDGGFYYESIHVEAVVHTDNVWEVTETMDVFFTEPRHGIYRYIPYTFSLNHDISQDPGQTPEYNQGQVVQDWRNFDYVSDVEDIRVEGGEYQVSEESENTIIRIGSPDELVAGKHRYIISYKYVYREDRRPQYDYIFHTILGTDYNEEIKKFTFRVEFEKPLPSDIQKRLEIYSGEYGSTESKVEGLTVKANAHFITGRAENVQPKHGITIYAKLPEGYYEDVKAVNYAFHYVFMGITIMLIILIVYYLFKKGRRTPTKVIEFYPPDDVSSGEVGTIIDGEVDPVDLASLIPWFAGKGYLSIVEEEEKSSGFFSKKTSVTNVSKKKDLPKDAPEYQKRMMNLLFSKGDTVCLDEMGEHPTEVKDIKDSLSNYFSGNKALSHYSWCIGLYFLLLIFSWGMFSTNSVTQTFDLWEWIVQGFLWCIPFIVGACTRLYFSGRDIFSSKWKRIVLFIVKALCMWGIYELYVNVLLAYGAPMNKWVALAIYVSCFLLVEMIGNFNVDTEYRIQMAGRLLGFREFIKTAEKPRLEALQAADPAYFYKVLPYAMVFGLSNKWSKLFKDIHVENPDWYDNSSTTLTGYALTSHLVNNLNTSCCKTMNIVSHDSSSSGSGGSWSGGGGFSGGGGGGGGAGSW